LAPQHATAMAAAATITNWPPASKNLDHQAQGGRVGNFNPVLYALSNAQAGSGATVFHRITSGSSSVPGEAGFSASSSDPTYNQATGLGSVDGGAFISSWNRVTPAVVGLQPTSATVPPGQFVGSVVLTLTSSSAWTASASQPAQSISRGPARPAVTLPMGLCRSGQCGRSVQDC
jgi:hypothetical protein